MNRIFARLSPVVGVVQMDGNDWRGTSSPCNSQSWCPRTCATYSWSLAALAYTGGSSIPSSPLVERQLHRVTEAAAIQRYRQLGGPSQQPSFKRAVDWLTENGAVASDDAPRWDTIRNLRNFVSHPSAHVAQVPGRFSGLSRLWPSA